MRVVFVAFVVLLCRVCDAQESSPPASPLPRASPSPLNVDPKLDCAIKQLAWDFARTQLTHQPRDQSRNIYDALQLEKCGVPPQPVNFPRAGHTSESDLPDSSNLLHRFKNAEVNIYADSSKGSDSNPGTIDKPVRTIKQAVIVWRSKKKSSEDYGSIHLAPGVYYPNETITLTPADSHLTVSGKGSVISGGKKYSFTWKSFSNDTKTYDGVNAVYGAASGQSSPIARYIGLMNSSSDCQKACSSDESCFAYTWHDKSTGKYANMCYFRADGLWDPVAESGHFSGKKINIMVADLSKQNPNNFSSLFINGRRAVRARYPDGNPEIMGLHTQPTGYVSKAAAWLPPEDKGKAKEIHIPNPERNGTHFPQFQIGIGGPVSAFDPPESYWGTASPTGGGGATYVIPTGLQYSDTEGFVNRTWAHPETGIVHAFHCGHWGNWQFALKGRDNSKRQLLFDYGGWQEARGCRNGAEWYVENIFEELDAPGEWFFDYIQKKLYLYPNGSLPDTGVGTQLKLLFRIQGSMDEPVQNVLLTNLTLTQTEPTFLDKYEVPSGGDWSVHRGAAVFAEGVDGFYVLNNVFDSPGGNGLFLSNYVRNANIAYNEFCLCGDSALVSVGSADLIDGTNGNQPRRTIIMCNVMREIGIWGKQTSPFVQALTTETIFQMNVFFNGPRAGINFNDGFGGGHFVKSNVGFNMVRETGDHGPFNSWDRQPYLTKVGDGKTPSLIQAPSYLQQNLLINNYHSTWPIDHDDGSCYYTDIKNFLVYGGYKNYLGHSKSVGNNYYIYPDASHDLGLGGFISKPFCANSDGASTGELPSGWGESYTNNTCVIGNPNIYEFGSCDPNKPLEGIVPMTANNNFYAPNKNVYIKCGGKQFTLAEYQKLGYDIGSTVNDPVDTSTIIQWGKDTLGL